MKEIYNQMVSVAICTGNICFSTYEPQHAERSNNRTVHFTHSEQELIPPVYNKTLGIVTGCL